MAILPYKHISVSLHSMDDLREFANAALEIQEQRDSLADENECLRTKLADAHAWEGSLHKENANLSFEIDGLRGEVARLTAAPPPIVVEAKAALKHAAENHRLRQRVIGLNEQIDELSGQASRAVEALGFDPDA